MRANHVFSAKRALAGSRFDPIRCYGECTRREKPAETPRSDDPRGTRLLDPHPIARALRAERNSP